MPSKKLAKAERSDRKDNSTRQSVQWMVGLTVPVALAVDILNWPI